MIRLFLLAAGFLSVTIALLVSQMGSPDETEGGTAEVTRTDTSAFAPAAAPQTQPRVIRVAPDPATGSPEPRAAAQNTQRDMQDSNPIDLMTQSILQELRKPVTGDRLRQVADQTQGQTEDMHALTEGVLAGLATASERAATTPTPTQSDDGSPQTLNALIIQAMRQGQSDEYVDQLLNEAVGKGKVEAPAAILTPSGEVDTATLLDSLVQQSFAAQGTTPAPAEEAEAEWVKVKIAKAPAPRPEPRKVKTTTPVATPASAAPGLDEDLFYVVQPGDSLAGIALRHYGTTTAHDIIFQANRNRLPSPSAVKPGMTLRIPAL